jgi:membrane-bound serine protease (ClpP class)
MMGRIGVVTSIAFAIIAASLSAVARLDAAPLPLWNQQNDAPADKKELPTGFIVKVPLPLVGEDDQRVISQLRVILEQPRTATLRPVVILHFQQSAADRQRELQTGEEQERIVSIGSGTNFERALSLARFLASPEAAGIKTVAYAEQRIEGHALLPVLACEQFLLGSSSGFGSVEKGQATSDEMVISSYQQIAKRRRSLPDAVVQVLLSPSAGLYRVELLSGESKYVNAESSEQLRKDGQSWQTNEIVKPGNSLFLSPALLIENKWLADTTNSYDDITRTLQLASLPQDASAPLGRLNGIAIQLKGHISLRLVASLISSIEKEIESGTNVIVLQINSEGGSPAASLQMANYLATLDPLRVITVAWIDGNARGDAAWIVAACRKRWMTPEAKWGGSGEATIGKREIDEAEAPLRQLSEASNVNFSTLSALASSSIDIYNYRHTLDGRIDRFTDSEVKKIADQPLWEQQKKLDWTNGLSSAEAILQGLAAGEIRSVDEIQSNLKLESSLRPIKVPWLELQIRRIANSPLIKNFILMIAIFTLMSELSTPGIGVAGFVSILAFGTFFWLQMFNGTLAWLELLLFAGGIAFLLAELFVLPGFGIFGIGGAIMILTSIILASQTFVLPSNPYQFDRFSWNLLGIASFSLMILAVAFIFRHQIERLPIFKQIALNPPDTQDLEELARREAMVDWGYLLHQSGTTVTRLNPSGKARIGESLVSVMSDGEMVSAGTPVKVVSVQGNNVIVKTI